MISRILAALVLALGVGLLPPAPALAVGPTVTVVDNVTWSFADSVQHTSTSNQGFWDSGRKSDGQQFARARTSNTTNGKDSDWSPVRSVTVS